MRDARCHLGNFAVTGKIGHRRSVSEARPAQPEPAGLQPEDIVAREIGKECFPQGRGRGVRGGPGFSGEGMEASSKAKRNGGDGFVPISPRFLILAGAPEAVCPCLLRVLIRWFDGNRRIDGPSAGLFCCHLGRHDRYECSALFREEADAAIGSGKEGMVLAHADIRAGMPFRAALTNNDVCRPRRPDRRSASRRGACSRSRDRCGRNRLLLVCHGTNP